VSVWVRLLLGTAVIGATAACLLIFDLTITAAAIEVVVFAFGIGTWVFFDSRADQADAAGGPEAKWIGARRKLSVKQEGPSPKVTGAVGTDVEIHQRAVDDG
jgi:hypothetical protein